MPELVLQRRFSAAPERVFAFVTDPDHLLRWWGPEGMHVPEGDLALNAEGPWWSVMQNRDGQRYKVSGVVEAVDPPRMVRFTWGWHDESDARGPGSVVTFEVEPDENGGSLFRLTHGGFADAEAMGNHEGGWTSSLRKLAALDND